MRARKGLGEQFHQNDDLECCCCPLMCLFCCYCSADMVMVWSRKGLAGKGWCGRCWELCFKLSAGRRASSLVEARKGVRLLGLAWPDPAEVQPMGMTGARGTCNDALLKAKTCWAHCRGVDWPLLCLHLPGTVELLCFICCMGTSQDLNSAVKETAAAWSASSRSCTYLW